MKLRTTGRFERDFARLPVSIQQRALEKLELLLANPRHPSLRLDKVAGHANMCRLGLSRAHRITCAPQEDTYVLRRIGSHDVLDRP